ncbi:hybrid sensor histidine kinase/response regulator [Paraburkholderia bonniea]|uniref:ATP-binding response regulator n=1 Tax=Paraburkholderia bonniea TaxID=2152891 RepID=UPI0012914BBA|nr:hybrid sensor histidine kinase/response regulator [Paraburkholderia bonniea]WJF89283.1 hybrid sensor histidine kinase/response regulator [Paraburkholderia bonniea]WJF92599.1 hybrid sensor histidine kinase/response regulator [Paraburkholderia bonniea]
MRFLPREAIPLSCAAQVHAAQMQILRNNFPFALVCGLVACVMFSIIVAQAFAAQVQLWLGAQVGLALLRYTLNRRYDRAQDNPAAMRRWRLWMFAGAVTAGLLWGLPSGYWMLHSPQSVQMFIIVALLALSTGAMSAYSVWLPVLYGFQLPFFVPTLGALALVSGTLDNILAAACALYLLATLVFSYRIHRTQIDSLVLRFENLALLKNLQLEKDAAERSDQAKSRFLAAASHDLRQPVHALSLYLGVLREQTLNPKSRHLVASISRAVSAMGSLFDALLNISRLDAGVVRPARRHFALSALFDDIKLEFAVRAADKNLILRVRGGAPAAWSDPVLVGQIVRNLVDNAIRHTRDGGILLAWRRRGGALCIEVWDTGPGIAEQDKEKIFWEFHQLSNPERDRNKGLGLGLAIVQRAAHLLNHPLTLRSLVGKGSVFALTLPAGLASQVVLVGLPTHQAHEPRGRQTHDKLVYVIEDDLENREGLRLLFETWGFRALAAEGLNEMLELTRTCEDKPDLVVSDYRLRQHDTGIDVIERLHEEYNDDQIPAILISADNTPGRLAEAEARGWPLLHKPIEPAQLHALATALLEQRAALNPGNGEVVEGGAVATVATPVAVATSADNMTGLASGG